MYGQGSVPDSQIMAKPKAVKELKANLGFSDVWGEAPERATSDPKFAFEATNMVI